MLRDFPIAARPHGPNNMITGQPFRDHSGIVSGGSCRSSAIATAQSLQTWSSPQIVAVCEPKFRENLKARTRRSIPAIVWATAKVSSLEEALTTIHSISLEDRGQPLMHE